MKTKSEIDPLSKSHGQRSLVGCSPWGHEESDTTERLHFYFSLSCIGEGNGNPLQCSCLENPRDGGAWWAVLNGVAQSQAQLKRLSSSSSSLLENSRPLSPWGPPDFFSTCLVIDSHRACSVPLLMSMLEAIPVLFHCNKTSATQKL